MDPILASITATEPSAADQIREAATLASISLGILSGFAGQRATRLGRQDGHLEDYTRKELERDVWIDGGLALFGVLLLAAAGPLFVAAVDRITPLFRLDTAFFGLFSLFYVGMLAVVAWVAMIGRRRRELVQMKPKPKNKPNPGNKGPGGQARSG